MNLCCRLQRIFQRCGRELGVRDGLNEILGHFIDDTDELALGIPIVVLRRRLDWSRPEPRPSIWVWSAVDPRPESVRFWMSAGSVRGVSQVLLGQLRISLLTQHVV